MIFLSSLGSERMGEMALPEHYEDLNEEMLVYLRDQHPRGQYILDNMPRRGENAEDVEEEELPTEEEVPPYEKWSVEELKTELKARKLSSSGKQEDLVLRLYENDKAEERSE